MIRTIIPLIGTTVSISAATAEPLGSQRIGNIAPHREAMLEVNEPDRAGQRGTWPHASQSALICTRAKRAKPNMGSTQVIYGVLNPC